MPYMALSHLHPIGVLDSHPRDTTSLYAMGMTFIIYYQLVIFIHFMDKQNHALQYIVQERLDHDIEVNHHVLAQF